MGSVGKAVGRALGKTGKTIVKAAAKDGIHLGNELKALPGISHLEK